MPAIFRYREFVTAGGLMSYGGSIADSYRLVGVYNGRVLKARSLPSCRSSRSPKIELIINLKTARALGTTVPLPLLDRTDEVIDESFAMW